MSTEDNVKRWSDSASSPSDDIRDEWERIRRKAEEPMPDGYISLSPLPQHAVNHALHEQRCAVAGQTGRIVRRFKDEDGTWMVEVEPIEHGGVLVPNEGFPVGGFSISGAAAAPQAPVSFIERAMLDVIEHNQGPIASRLHQLDERPPVPRSLRPRWLGPLNFGLLQWFGVRLQRTLGFRDGAWFHGAWNLRRWVLPLTGWWSRYIETRGAK